VVAALQPANHHQILTKTFENWKKEFALRQFLRHEFEKK
jgi:hypothetical protein